MSQPHEKHPTPDSVGLPAPRRDSGGAVFNAPWEAQSFAIAVKLSEAGHFSWGEWVDAFSREIRSFEGQGAYDPAADDGHHYYEIWLSTLVKLIAQKGVFDLAAFNARHRHLAETPVPHDHVARREPVCIA